MKCQKVIALLLSTALSVSTCISLGNTAVLGAEPAVTAQSAEEAEKQTETADSSEEESTEQADMEEETESEEEAAAGDNQEVNTEKTDAEDTETAESSETGLSEAETAGQETESTTTDNEAEDIVPAQEAESSDTETTASDRKSESDAPEKVSVPASDMSKEERTESSTVITSPAQNYIELSPEDNFSKAIEIKAGDTKTVSIADEDGYVLYRFIPKATKGYSFYSFNNTFDPVCHLYDSQKQLIDVYHDTDEDDNFNFNRILTAGQTYYFQVGTSNEDGGTCKVHLEQIDFSCERVGESDLKVPLNEKVTLQVKAVSSSKIYYQWYDSNDKAIRGATSAAYTFTASKSDYYYCDISDESGHEEEIFFSVNIENHLKIYPEGEDEDSGEKIIYTAYNTSVDLRVIVSADNTTGLSYSWDMDDEEIEGAAASSYKTGPITGKHRFECYVTDCYDNCEIAAFEVNVLDFSAAQSIKPGDSRQVSLSEEKPFAVFKFTPTQTSGYTFYSTDNTVDSRVEVVDDSYDMIFYDEYSGGDDNFKLTKEFTAGTTYYILAKSCYSDEYGSYTIHLKKESRKIQTISASDMTLSCGSSKKITVSGAKGELVFYSSDETIADVNDDGLVTTFTPGTTKIHIYAFDTFHIDHRLAGYLLIW